MNNDKPLSQEDFDFIYDKVPRLTVEVILSTPQGVVLTKRCIKPCKGQWHIPGGTVHFGESLDTALKRVALDELGVLIKPKRLIGCIQYPDMHTDGYSGWPIGIAFEVEHLKGEFRGSEQAEIIEFFKEVPPNTLSEQATFLKKYFAGEISYNSNYEKR